MEAVILFPAIDLKNGQCVRLEQGDMARATVFNLDPAAQAAVRAIDRRRLDYIEALLQRRGFPAAIAQARAQILYWTFLGYAFSAPQLPAARLQGLLDEIQRMVSA